VKSRLLSVPAVLCLAMMITFAHTGSAQQVQPLEHEWLIQMYGEGWQKVQEGVLQRSAEGGSLETFTYGEEGLLFSIQKLEERLAFLQSAYDQNPTDELAWSIDRLNEQLSEANGQVGSLEAEPFGGGAELENCNVAYGAHAYATPLGGASAPGVTATADAHFHNDCGYVGFTDVFAYSKATIGTTETIKSQQDPKGPSTWIDSYATSMVSGPLACYSWAWGRSWSYQLNFDYYTEAPANYSCPDPVVASITGPTGLLLNSTTPCKNVTWTASATGGSPAYSYNWYIGSVYQGSGSQLTKQYCTTTTSVTVTVIAQDAIGQTDNESFTTQITYFEPPPNDCYPYKICPREPLY
jgi:hypothetical protein